MDKKKVAFLVTSLNSGGIENYLLRFLRFSEGKILPFVICKSGEFGELEEKFKKIENIQLLKFHEGRLNPVSLYQLSRFLKKNAMDTVCDFTGNFAGQVLLIAAWEGILKRIVFYRGSTNHFKESFFRMKYNSFMNWLVKKYATKIFSNSKSALDYFYPERSFTDTRFKVIANGVDAVSFSINVDRDLLRKEISVPTGAFIIGHTGRYNRAKNHDTIAKVANELCMQYQDIYFVICGKGTREFKSEVDIKYPGLKSRLIALGYRNDINLVLKTFDLYFFPSVTEGQPNALIEAMISGLPIVASDIQPIKETTPVNIHPKLKDPLDVDGFFKELEKAYLDPKYRESLIYTEWAKSNFNARTLFNQFLQEL